MIYFLSFSCEHGRDTGIQKTNVLDYPVKPGNDKSCGALGKARPTFLLFSYLLHMINTFLDERFRADIGTIGNWAFNRFNTFLGNFAGVF
jgi:hypothetical protein